MDFQYAFLLLGAATLATGVGLCWLVMRGRVTGAAAQATAEAQDAFQAELAIARQRSESLDSERQMAVANFEKLSFQTGQLRETLDEAHAEQTRLAERAAQVETLEAELTTLRELEKASRQELRMLSTSDAESVEALKRVSARLAEIEDEDAALKRALANNLDQATRLPVLESEVLALQNLAKTIQDDFSALLEAQRNFTAASSALQDVS